MAKSRNNSKKKNSDGKGKAPMDTTEVIVSDLPQEMDTSESASRTQSSDFLARKVKRGVQMKRTQNVRKKKAIAKAISKTEKQSEKVLKHEGKKIRVQSAKSLYD